MSKKKAVILVVSLEILIYLFLLIVMPIIESTLCPTCNIREEFTSITMPLYFTPGLIGALMLLLIWKQKPEVNKDE